MYQTDQYEGMIAETVAMRGHNGDLINAYLARPRVHDSSVFTHRCLPN